jgi:hypothetical protein
VPNPNIPQGTISKFITSITFDAYPALNITAPFLGRSMVSFTREGNAVQALPTATGIVLSPEAYMLVRIGVTLLKSQSLCQLFEAQLAQNAILGLATIRPDVQSGGLQPFDVQQCCIETPGGLALDGSSPDYPLSLLAQFPINNSLWP